MKTNKEQALEIVQEMIDNGWKLVGETAEQWCDRVSWNVEFLRGILEQVKRWPK